MDSQALVKLGDALWNRRSELDAHYEEIARCIFPARSGFGTGSAPDRQAVFDATPEEAANLLAAALHSLLTNPAGVWFNLQVPGLPAGRSLELDRWLDESRRLMLDVFNDPATGFTNEVSSLYLDLGPFGWGVFYSEDEAGEPLRFRALPPYECAVGEDRHGRVDKLVRRYQLEAGQALDLFSPQDSAPGRHDELTRIGQLWRERAGQEPLAKVGICHLVLPMHEVPGGFPTPAAGQRFASIYMDRESGCVLHSGGFYEFPFQVPRWSKVSGDVYGRGPGWAALPDVRVLNAVSEAQLLAAEKQADPPLLVPDDGVLGKIRTFAGGVTYYRPGNGDILPLPVASDLGTMQAVREEKQDAIRRAFLNDRILMSGGPQMTATEVLTRENRQMLILGPVLGRLQSEFLGPLVERVFGILLRRGQLPPPPPGFGGKIHVSYVSPIARAQKQVEAQAFQQATAFLAPVLQINPAAAGLFDAEAIVRDSQTLFGYPAAYLRTLHPQQELNHERL